jgi:adenylate kinase
MANRVILVTGTPAVGKTTVARRLAEHQSADYVNLTEFAYKENLVLEEDKSRKTAIIDEAKMRRKLKALIRESKKNVVVDGHYAAAVTPKSMVTNVFVLRRNPIQLRELMRKRQYDEAKQKENLEAEILDVCLVEALSKQEKSKVCELDVSDKTVNETLNEILDVLEGKRGCYVGCVDWLGMLEREGKTAEFLKP